MSTTPPELGEGGRVEYLTLPRHPLHDYIVSCEMTPIRDEVSRAVRGFLVWYFCGGQRFQVLVSKVPPVDHDQGDAIEVEWVNVYSQAMVQGDDDDDSLGEFEMMATDRIKELAIPLMVEMAPPSTAEPPTWKVGGDELPQTVEQLLGLYWNTVKLQLVTRNGELEVIRGHTPDVSASLPPIPWTRVGSLCSSDIRSIPTFPSTQVTLRGAHFYGIESYSEFEFEATISGSDGPVVCLLMGDKTLDMNNFLHQLEKLVKIRDAGFHDAEVRVPTIKGLITHEDGVVGVILYMIAHATTLDTVLYEIDYNTTGIKREQPAAPLPSRQKWVTQIEHTLLQLHSHGIVWSPHPEHVVIDTDGNAHLTDFTNYVFYEWVPRRRDRHSMSVEADLEGLKVIKRLLLPERYGGD